MSNYKSYFLKSMGLREDNLPGGKGDESQPNQVDQEQLQMGIKVEMEHTHDQDLAKEIAMDHLSEDPQYYSHLKSAGMADELPNGQQPPNQPPMMMNKLMSPTAIMPTPVIAVGVRGSNTGGFPGGGEINTSEKSRMGGLEPLKVLPKGGAVGDKEKSRLGGLELVKNPKANSQGAFANTPSSDALKADGGHYTPDNKDINQGKAPETSKKGGDEEHPMQFQKMGTPPPKDDGTGRNGDGLKPVKPEPTEPHPMSGPIAGPEGGTNADKDLSGAGIDDKPEAEEKEAPKGPWGIGLGDEDEDEDEEGEDVSIDIKETLKEALGAAAVKAIKEEPVKECGTCGCGNPADDHGMKDRFQQLANIKTEAGMTSESHTCRGCGEDRDAEELDRKGYCTDCRGGGPGSNMGYGPDTGPSVPSSRPIRAPGDPTHWGDVNEKARFQKLANIPVKEDGERSDHEIASTETSPLDYAECPKCKQPNHLCHCDNEMPSTRKWAQDAVKRKQLEELVGRLNAKGKVTPLLQKAQAYLVKSKSK